MRFRALASMISTANDYSLLKWPLVIVSFLITLLALTLLLSFQSNTWFTYESFNTIEKTTSSSQTTKPNRFLEYGSFGLWKVCIGHDQDLTMNCNIWTRRSRPEFFNVVIVLSSCTLFLANLTIFPSWIVTILVLYNLHNRYIRHIVVFLWILFSLSFLFTVLLIGVMMLIGVSKYYSPGKFFLDTKFIYFHTGPGILLMLMGTILAFICLLIFIIALIWKKFIDMRLIEEEKQLYRQLTDDNYSYGWHHMTQIPRNESTVDDDFEDPPPYNPNQT